MKAILAFLAVCFVAVQAAHVRQPPVNYEIEVNDILNELAQITIQTAQALEHQFEEIVLEPLHQLDEAVQSIEERREESPHCVAAEDENVFAIVDQMHGDMTVCGTVAAKTSADIAIDVTKATQQLLFDGYDVLATYEKCRNYKNSVLKNTCYARLSIKATLYLTNARKSIKVINESKNERIPAVAVESNVCTHTASDAAINEFDNVHQRIDFCVTKKKN